MNSAIGQKRYLGYILTVFVGTLLFLNSCASTPVTKPPVIPDGMTALMLQTQPSAIALNRLDLPAGFQLAAEKTVGAEYVALYLRPSALDDRRSGGNSLLSVLISVGVYTTTAYAESVYLRAAANPVQEALTHSTLLSGHAADQVTDFVTEPYAGAAQGANAAETYRVSYRLQEQPIFEYGYRFRLGNILAYVVVAAIGNPDEPQHLLTAARDLVQRQIDHIVEEASNMKAP